MAEGMSHNCKPDHPCAVCGKPDYCDWVEFPNGDLLSLCHREPGNVGDVKAFSGGLYKLKYITPNEFYAWEAIDQYERNLAAYLEAKGIEKSKGRTGYGYAKNSGAEAESPRKRIERGIVEPLPPQQLDRFYRTLLDKLVLEDKHRRVLSNEWDKVPGLTQRILDQYPIKSMPPYDVVRFSTEERLRNKSRKRIISELVEALGEPKGVRGFYKKNNGAWELACKGGILYPEIDVDGYICGLRYADDYPVVTGIVDGAKGQLVYKRIGDSPAGWYFTPEGGEERKVFTYGSSDNEISLDTKGYPDVEGRKIDGKYKAISSFRLVKAEENGREIVYENSYQQGTRHVTRPALFTKPSDECLVCYLTEGEKKGIVGNMLLNNPVISIPGTGSIGMVISEETGRNMLNALKNKGMELLVIALDADKASNAKVLRDEERGVKAAMAAGIKVAIGEWNPLWGKGLDDTLLMGVKPKIYPVH